MMLNENALVSLEAAKEFLDIPDAETSYDNRITRLINVASSAIESHTSRKLRFQSHTLVVDGTRTNAILLTHYPVVSVTSVKVSRNSTDFANAFSFDADDYRVEQGGVLRFVNGNIASRGVQNIQIIYDAGYELPAQSATGAEKLPSDISEACFFLIDFYYQMAEDRRVGVTSKNRNGQNISFVQGMPEFIEELLSKYVRLDFPHFETQPGNF